MGHKNNNIYNEVISTLNSMAVFGRPKYEDKKNNDTKNKIYSYVTFEIYKRHCIQFATYAKKNYKCKSLSEAMPYVNAYLSSKIEAGHSPWSLKLYACALGKLYQMSCSDFMPLQPRYRECITRSRLATANDKYYTSPKFQELIHFCKHTGLRRSELENLRGKDLICKNGEFFVYVASGKGGKTRLVPILDNDSEVIKKIQNTSDDKRVWGHVSGLDIHSYRADYARALYYKNERPIAYISHNERYYCRKDMRGFVFDKKAMEYVSRALGHERICVMAYSYLYP